MPDRRWRMHKNARRLFHGPVDLVVPRLMRKHQNTDIVAEELEVKRVTVVRELKALGWTFNRATGEWVEPSTEKEFAS